MALWIQWYRCVSELRGACSRVRTFVWMALALVGFSIRGDQFGVTSFVRATFLNPDKYRRLLHLFHSRALDLNKLTQLWVRFCLRNFTPFTFQGHPVVIADGLKVPKEGKKMPAVKALHQSSDNNSKAPFIMGHSFQVVALLVQGALGELFSVPLASRIHEGLVFCNAHKWTLLDKLVDLFLPIAAILGERTILLADAYYASRKIILPLLEQEHELVTRVRSTTVAYLPVPEPKRPKKGRPRIYGKKVWLSELWKNSQAFITALSPVYGETGVEIRYLVKDLMWRPVGRLVRFVLVKHPTRGKLIIMTTMLSLTPLQAIELYGARFKIEVGFRQALHTLGTYGYHFWMMDMDPIRRRSGNQHLHRKSKLYRQAVRGKMDAYHRYVQLGCIAQGILQFLAVTRRTLVWNHFGSWLRTMKTDQSPSEMVVAHALRETLPHFLVASHGTHDLAKFIAENADADRLPRLTLAG